MSAGKMSRDRVVFYLPSKYYQRDMTNRSNGMSLDGMSNVFAKSFGIEVGEAMEILTDSQNREGLGIICRPSQFARFIVNRAELKMGVNGIQDLRPKLMMEDEIDPIACASAELELHRNDVQAVLDHFGVDYLNKRVMLSPGRFGPVRNRNGQFPERVYNFVFKQAKHDAPA